PKEVIVRARQRLRELETSAQRPAEQQQSHLPLFDSEPPRPETSEMEQLLQEIEPDELSPREALEALYRLKEKLEE
ncbi:MAG: hypothetical protein B6D74_14470, partial [gamma proteobacterium symbiont of Ctena orbiculata]